MKAIKDLSYVEFISYIKETNRCPGGKDTINWILQNSFLTKGNQVLEIGSNTGFSSLEVARTIKCQVLGIDVVPEAVAIADEELSRDTHEIQELVKFKAASAYELPCLDDSIDLVIAGGSTSFMDDKQQAISEVKRVIKPWGFLSVTNLFYHTTPPQSVLDSVSKIIGATIEPLAADDWIDIYTRNDMFELYKYERVNLSSRTEAEIDSYVEYFLKKPHLALLPAADQAELRQRWTDILMAFNQNHKYLGFIKALLRKRVIPEEPELFKLS